MKNTLRLLATTLVLLSFSKLSFTQVAPDLGVATTFALFTATGAFNGDLGTSVVGDIGTNVGAFTPPGVLLGTAHVVDAVSALAAVDVAEAFMDLEMDNTCGVNLGTPFGNQTLGPGVYCLGGASVLNGTLTLDAGGNPNAIFVFKIGGALSTDDLSNIALINGASFCNVYFRVVGAVNLGSRSFFRGTIVASGAINLGVAATLIGRGLSTAGAISTDANVVQLLPACVVPVPPVITCPANVMVSCAALVPAPNIATVTVSVSCPGLFMVTHVGDMISNQTCANRFTITRTYQVADACGNVVRCAQIITVNDQTAPMITCPGPVMVSCGAQVPMGSNTAAAANDNCGGPVMVTFNDVISNQTCPNRFTVTRTYTGTDACGNAGRCDQIITVNDQTPPVIMTCPGNVAVSCVPPGNPAAVTATDNCGGVVTVTFNDVANNQNCPNRLTITRTYTATDNCGNASRCDQIITVNDQTAPIITCPAPITVPCANQVPLPDPTSVTANDNCGGPVTVTFVSDVISNRTCDNRFTITRTYQGRDLCGNVAMCTQIITVNDQTAPTLTCPANVVVSCANQVPPPNPASVIAGDNCGGAVMVTFVGDVITARTCDNRFTITRTYQGVDACGNVAMCTQIIAVNDQTVPTITCPANVVVSCVGQVPPPDPARITATDNCGGAVTVTFVGDVITAQTCANRFTITRTYQGVDACGNVGTCTQTITVNDQTPPTITCPANVQVSCASQVPAGNPAGIVTTDNCGGAVTVTFADVITNQTCVNRFTILRTYTATDVCGNVAICVQTITVNDQTAPAITCPVNVTISCLGTLPPNPATVTATDNCGGVVTVTFVSDVISNLRCPNGLTITRTYQAADVCGNVAICAQTITVLDLTLPVITCPANVTVSCTSQVPPANPASVTTSDNCGGAVTVTFVGDVISNLVCANQYTITRTYQAVDVCGNIAFCTQTITVNDQTPPIFTVLPQNLEIECVTGTDWENALAAWLAQFGQAQISDECGTAFLTAVVLVSELPGVCGPNTFVRTYEFRITDACGNTNFARATFSVVDTTPPVIVCPPGNILLTCEYDLPTTDLILVQATDNCDVDVEITVIISSVGTGCVDWVRSVNYWYMATDDCGNMSNCDVSFQIIDSIPPIYNGPDTIDVGCVNDLPGPGAITGFLAPYMTDNCYDIVCFGRLTGQNGSTWVSYMVKVKDFCGNWADKFTVTFIATGACQPLCTAPQTTWGDPAGVINGMSTTAAIEQFMNEHGGVTAGKLGKTITATSTLCVQGLLPGSGTTAQFSPPGQHTFGADNNCNPTSPLLNNNGTLKNKLAANVMAMQFNIWYNQTFHNRSLGVQGLAGLPVCVVNPVVLDKLEADQHTVQGLLDLSNDYLAGVGFYPQGFGELLSNALDQLNSYWQNCQVNNPCPTNVSVAGALRTELQDGLEEVAVSLVAAHPTVSPISIFDVTDAQGHYRFSNAVPQASNLTLTPAKDDNPLNGVTTYDLALISKHILGLQPLGSPYKMIAADANKSGSITTSDIVELRKLILGIYQELPNNTSWRFVDQSFAFPDPANPFQTLFPENKTVANIQASQLEDDFVAVKIGDVSQNAIPNAQQGGEDRTTGTLFMDVEDRTVQTGESFDLTFQTAEAAQGFQFTLKLNGVSVSEIISGDKVGAENFGVFQDVLTVSVDGAQSFTVRFRATRAAKISELLSVSGEITKAEGYNLHGERQEIALRFQSPEGITTSGVGFELYQNQPNPFQHRTLIGFHLPAATSATLTVYDESGRTIFTRQGDYAKGYNTIPVELSVLHNAGLLYYKLETATDVATKKMIQVK